MKEIVIRCILSLILTICEAQNDQNSLFFNVKRKDDRKITVNLEPSPSIHQSHGIEAKVPPESMDREDKPRNRRKTEFVSGDNTSYNYHFQDPLTGTYKFGYRTLHQYREEERMPDGVTVGSYGWKDGFGRWHKTNFVSDHNGYRVIRPGQKVNFFVTPSPTFKIQQNVKPFSQSLKHFLPLAHNPQDIQIPYAADEIQPPKKEFSKLGPTTHEEKIAGLNNRPSILQNKYQIRNKYKSTPTGRPAIAYPLPFHSLRAENSEPAEAITGGSRPLNKLGVISSQRPVKPPPVVYKDIDRIKQQPDESETDQDVDLPLQIPFTLQNSLENIRPQIQVKPVTDFNSVSVPGVQISPIPRPTNFKSEDDIFTNGDDMKDSIEKSEEEDLVYSNLKPDSPPNLITNDIFHQPPPSNPAPHPLLQIVKHFFGGPPKPQRRQPKPKPTHIVQALENINDNNKYKSQADPPKPNKPSRPVNLPLNFLANAFLRGLFGSDLTNNFKRRKPSTNRKPSLDYDLLSSEMVEPGTQLHKSSFFQSMKEFNKLKEPSQVRKKEVENKQNTRIIPNEKANSNNDEKGSNQAVLKNSNNAETMNLMNVRTQRDPLKKINRNQLPRSKPKRRRPAPPNPEREKAVALDFLNKFLQKSQSKLSGKKDLQPQAVQILE